MLIRRFAIATLLGCLAAPWPASAQRHHVAGGDEFASAMASAMSRMDNAMMVPPSGNPDRDFAEMMIPHHQGAIDMAEAELRFGHNEILRRLAQAIIVEQRQEIAVMRQTLAALPIPQATTNPASPLRQSYIHTHKEP